MAILLLLFVIAPLALTPENVTVAPGETVSIAANYPSAALHGASFSAEDPAIAIVSGHIPTGSTTADVAVTGVRLGTTRIIGTFPGGFNIWYIPVGTVTVQEPECVPPTITLPLERLRINDLRPLTIAASVSGSAPASVDWFERFDGGVVVLLQPNANPLNASLPLGVHRLFATATNRCGSSSSGDIVIEVVPQRQRPARR